MSTFRQDNGLGAIEAILADDEVTDLVINGPGPLTVERGGVLEVVGSIDAAELDRLVEYLLAPTGRRVDRRTPIADVRIDDRTRCHIVVPPVAVRGVSVALRRFPSRPRPLTDFTTTAGAEELRQVVVERENVIVFGQTGSGKTSLLSALLNEVADAERVVVAEESAELVVGGPHAVRLEAQPVNLDGLGGVSLFELVRAALRMRPDRLVVGEVRGSEAAGLLHALSTGHRGSMGTVHARDVTGALWRLSNLAIAGGAVGDVEAQFGRVVDVAIEMDRGTAGRRRVAEIHRLRSGVGS